MQDFRVKTFLTVCRTLNYTRAAEELALTQPAVSQHITYLEREYGAKLFTYHRKKLELTPAGRVLRDGLATMAAGCLGGPANTTYSENTGVLAVTKNYNPTTLRIAAVFAMLMSFLGVFQTFLSSIPGPVMGGVSIILFGMISAVGMRTLVEAQLDFTHSRNLMIVAVMLVSGLGLSGGIQITESSPSATLPSVQFLASFSIKFCLKKCNFFQKRGAKCASFSCNHLPA